MSDLASKRCIPCEGDVPALTPLQAKDLMEQIPQWSLSPDATVISREFKFKDFKQALEFANKVGAVAEKDWHHPELVVAWGKVSVTLTTHSIKGLSENDFIVAAKVDQI